jgi:hypothetical protein
MSDCVWVVWQALVREYSKEAAGLEYTPEEKLREDDIKMARKEARTYVGSIDIDR